MTAPITDHSYRPDRAGQWFTGRCDLCGEPEGVHGRGACGCGHDRDYHGNADGQTGWQAACGHPDCDCDDYEAES